MKAEDFENLSKKDLRRMANECFAKADEVGDLHGPAHLSRAQFYLHEIDRRWDSWIALRDLVLEIVVILLIGGEIWLGVSEGRRQSAAFDKMEMVLTNLQISSETTANSLIALQAQQVKLTEQTTEEATSRPDARLVLVRGESTLAAKAQNVGTLKAAEGTFCDYYVWNLDETDGKTVQLENGVARFGALSPGQLSSLWTVSEGYRYKTSPAYAPGNRILAYFETGCLQCKTKRSYWAILTLGTMDGGYIEASPINPRLFSLDQLNQKAAQLKRQSGLTQIGGDSQLH